MDAVKYLKELDRMCKYYNHNCQKCLLHKSDYISCKNVQTLNPEKAVKIVEKWSAENPQKTMLQDFLEKYPNAYLADNGRPLTICPHSLGYEDRKDSPCRNKLANCVACWNRPLEG